MLESEDKSVQDIGADWESVLGEASKTDQRVQATGRAASTAGSPGALVATPKVTTKDVVPLVRALGMAGTRLAQVEGLTAEEVEGIAEPTAILLSMLAPNMPPWAIPASVLAARLGDIASKRADEFRANQKERATQGPGEQSEPTYTDAEGF